MLAFDGLISRHYTDEINLRKNFYFKTAKSTIKIVLSSQEYQENTKDTITKKHIFSSEITI